MVKKVKIEKVEESGRDLRRTLALRRRLRNATTPVRKGEQQVAADVLARRAVEWEEDPFTTFYRGGILAAPPYSFEALYRVYEQSDVLQACIEAIQQNVDGFGFQMQFRGDDLKQQTSEEAQRQLRLTEDFFRHANDEQSWMTIRKKMRLDYEVIGNGAFEVVRNLAGQVAMVYYMPFKQVRLAAKAGDPITIQVKVPRNGKLVFLKVQKYFRKYAQLSELSGQTLRWFKSFGDPRVLNAITGEFVKTGEKPPKLAASEVLHFRRSCGASLYGIPKWVGVALDVVGRRSSQFVNYDLFESQGIPPMVITVSGGTLTDDSIEELETMIRGMRGTTKWNRVALLESNPESKGLEDSGNAKIEIKNLAEYRKEDQMFTKYLEETENTIRQRFRLPPLYTGGTDSFTHATAIEARRAAEEQVFVPERLEFDETVNNRIVVTELGVTLWEYKTKGPRIVGADEISSAVETFSDAGAFSINHAIEMANESFGMQMSKFSESWADFPLPLILKLLDTGRMVKGMEALVEASAPPTLPPVGAGAAGEVVPVITEKAQATLQALANLFDKAAEVKKTSHVPIVREKIFKSGLFNAEEIAMYKRLLQIQQVVDAKTAVVDAADPE